MALKSRELTGWLFATGETEDCLSAARSVRVPHTWSVEEGEPIVGTGWYRTSLGPEAAPGGQRAFLYFHAVYRDAQVFVNGTLCAGHRGCGYTPFLVEITGLVKSGQANTVTVRVDNRFSEEAMPCGRSFDWANDGGIFRRVELLVTGPACLGDADITARPVILPGGQRQDRGMAVFGFKVNGSGAEAGARLRWALHRGAADSVTPVEAEPAAAGEIPFAEEMTLPSRVLDAVSYWHFDRPELYTLRLRAVLGDGRESDFREWVIGFRELALQGSVWRLNGEAVRLPGTEWMPGSDPDLGMAEGRENLEKMLGILKESNSVLTRFHWQQDDIVYDWCDRHGMLVQEEVPFWGKQPEGDPEKLWPVARQQMEEMIRAHRHHPSIIAWGVGNELSAGDWPVQRYIRRAVAFARSLDGTRLGNYVSNTAFASPEHDGSGEGDIPMINDYIGTWHQGFDQEAAWKSLLDARPGRAWIPSEYGLCEPAFSGGDPRREQIFLEKMACYRAIPEIAGTVYFCLNDYRTHMGEEGEGRMKRRVHGSAGLDGTPKPSYFTVRREYAPLVAERVGDGLRLTCRKDIPSYTVSGYMLRADGVVREIPELRPGESWLYEGTAQAWSITRPSGDAVLEA